MAFHYVGTGRTCDGATWDIVGPLKRQAITAGIRPGASSGQNAERLERQALEATTRAAIDHGLPPRDGFYDINAQTWEFMEVHETPPALPLAMVNSSSADVVAFVKRVLGEVDRAKAGTGRSVAVRLLSNRNGYPGTRCIEVRYILEGRRILGTYLIPIPEEVWAVLCDPEANPYDNAEAVFSATETVPGPVPVPAPPPAADHA